MNDLQVRIRAAQLRKKFEGHAGIVVQIIRDFSDAQLVYEYDQFESDRLLHHKAKRDA